MKVCEFELIDDLTAPVKTETVSPARAYGLRPYQGEAFDAIYKGWEEEDVRVQMSVMATGLGKTPLMAAIAKHEVKALKHRVLILAHRDELVDQAIDKTAKLMGMRAEKEKASHYASRFAGIVVGSVQTMAGTLRLSSWPKKHFHTVMVDECHHLLSDQYQKVLQHFMEGGARVIGVTATPDRGDNRGLGEFVDRIASEYGLLHGVRDGWLVRPIFKTMPVTINLDGIRTKHTSEGNDFDRMEVGKRLAPIIGAIAEQIKKHSGSKKILIFMPSVETAKMMADAMNEIGVPSAWVCGDKKICPDRAERIASHKARTIRCLTNFGILTEGYDDDEIEVLVNLRATKIRSLFCQVIGRGTRPLASIVPLLAQAVNAYERNEIIKNSAKPFLTVLDFLWQYKKHDLCKPASLVTDRQELADQVEKNIDATGGDLIEAEERAEVDLLKKLEEAVRKNENRKAETVDPLALAAELGDLEMANYTPDTKRDAQIPTTEQLRQLMANGINVSNVKHRGHARLILERLVKRHEQGLCHARQLNFLKTLGIDATHMTQGEAHEVITKWTEAQGGRKDVIA